MPLFDLDCGTCGRVDDVRARNTDRDDEGRVRCPGCGEWAPRYFDRPVALLGLGGEAGYSKGYPYFDRSLRMRISDRAHHDRVLEQRGLRRVEPGEIEKIGARMRAQDEEIDREIAEQNREIEEAPHFAEFRKQRDSGELVDHIENKRERELTQKALVASTKEA